MDKVLTRFFMDNGFEIVEKKTTTQVTIDGLHVFSIKKRRGGLYDISINLVKDAEEKAVLEKRSEGFDVNFEKTPIMKNVSTSTFVRFCKETSLIPQVKRMSEFREVQSEFTLSVAEKGGKTLKWRSNLPTEKHIVDAVFRGSEYTERSVELGGLKLNKEDVVLDLGTNIGAFTVDIFDKVKKVIAFEPEDVNFEFASINIEDNNAKNVTAFKKAVVGNDDKVRDFYLGKVPYYYSFLVKGNRKRVPVECVNINDVMQKYNPTKMKVDIEGSEWEVLISCKDFGRVDQIIFEYNFDMNHDLKTDYERFDALKEHLRNHGFNVQEMERDLKKNWNMVFMVEK